MDTRKKQRLYAYCHKRQWPCRFFCKTTCAVKSKVGNFSKRFFLHVSVSRCSLLRLLWIQLLLFITSQRWNDTVVKNGLAKLEIIPNKRCVRLFVENHVLPPICDECSSALIVKVGCGIWLAKSVCPISEQPCMALWFSTGQSVRAHAPENTNRQANVRMCQTYTNSVPMLLNANTLR